MAKVRIKLPAAMAEKFATDPPVPPPPETPPEVPPVKKPTARAVRVAEPVTAAVVDVLTESASGYNGKRTSHGVVVAGIGVPDDAVAAAEAVLGPLREQCTGVEIEIRLWSMTGPEAAFMNRVRETFGIDRDRAKKSP
jgi:hypothetical protein